MAVTDDRQFLILTHQAANSISVYDISKSRVTQTIACQSPGSVLCRGSKVFVAGRGTNAINVYSQTEQLLHQETLTIDRSGNAGGGPHPGVFAVTWRANMWANINRSGHGNLPHTHPGAFWSGVYYVDDGGISADPSLGGALEFLDPRGAGPVMYAPHLGFAMKGGLSGGANEVLQPKAGRLVLFPSWLLHQVRHYRGTAERISIAFNLNL